MKGLIIGLAAGMAAGALLAINCKECRKMIDKVYNDLKRFMSATKLLNTPMTNDDFKNMIAYDFENPSVDEYYFSVLKDLKNIETEISIKRG